MEINYLFWSPSESEYEIVLTGAPWMLSNRTGGFGFAKSSFVDVRWTSVSHHYAFGCRSNRSLDSLLQDEWWAWQDVWKISMLTCKMQRLWMTHELEMRKPTRKFYEQWTFWSTDLSRWKFGCRAVASSASYFQSKTNYVLRKKDHCVVRARRLQPLFWQNVEVLLLNVSFGCRVVGNAQTEAMREELQKKA